MGAAIEEGMAYGSPLSADDLGPLYYQPTNKQTKLLDWVACSVYHLWRFVF